MNSMIMLNQLRPSSVVTGSLVRRKLLSILDMIDFNEKYPEVPQWEYFEFGAVEQVINQCEQRRASSLIVIDVHQLHQLLNRELNELQGSAALGQRPLIAQEIQNILAYVVKRNSVRESIHSKRLIFEAWRQVTETILTTFTVDLLEGEKRQRILFELIQELIHKVLYQSTLPELSNLVSGVILTLLANLRQCFFASTPSAMSDSNHLTLLNGSSIIPDASVSLSTRSFHSSSLQVVLKGLIECILKSGLGPQRVRANYYAALLNFLRIARKMKPFPSLHNRPEDKLQGGDRNILEQELEHEKLSRENIEVILSYGEHFMEVVCRDCCASHDVNRMLSLACLDVIVSIDRNYHWLNYIVSKGYLRHLIESLLHDDQQLKNLIVSSSEPLHALYIYESKMALFCRLANSATGANSLLDNGIISALVECKVFDLRPEQDLSKESSAMLPPVTPYPQTDEESFLVLAIGRYRQVLFPALRLCLAITAPLGQDNVNTARQLLRFIVAHIDVFCTILRERHIVLTLPILQELSFVAKVVARAMVSGIDNLDYDNSLELDVQGQVQRFDRLMIALLQRYALTDSLQYHITTNLPAGLIQNQVQITLLEILSASLSYCRSQVAVSYGHRQLTPILFLPNLIEAVTKDTFNLKDFQIMLTVPRTPNLGVVVHHLQKCIDLFRVAFDTHNNLMKKFDKIPELGLEEIKEFLPDISEKLSGQTRKQTVQQHLLKLLMYKAQEVKLYSFMTENALYLVWIHLEHYLVSSVPDESMNFGFSHHEQIISTEDLKQLKADVLSCVNESLFRKLQEIVQDYTQHTTQSSFVEVLIRKLKRIVRLST